MNEMDNYFNALLDKICDENNNEAIVLKNENGEEIAFEQIAVIPENDVLYLIMRPVVPIEGVGEDEGLVFLVNEGMKRFELVVDDEIIDRVFAVYDKLVEAEEEGNEQ